MFSRYHDITHSLRQSAIIYFIVILLANCPIPTFWRVGDRAHRQDRAPIERVQIQAQVPSLDLGRVAMTGTSPFHSSSPSIALDNAEYTSWICWYPPENGANNCLYFLCIQFKYRVVSFELKRYHIFFNRPCRKVTLTTKSLRLWFWGNQTICWPGFCTSIICCRHSTLKITTTEHYSPNQ